MSRSMTYLSMCLTGMALLVAVGCISPATVPAGGDGDVGGEDVGGDGASDAAAAIDDDGGRDQGGSSDVRTDAAQIDSGMVGEVLLFEDFESYSDGDDPEDWFDTPKDNALTEDPDVFRIRNRDSSKVLVAERDAFNIHSHYVGQGATDWSSYEFTGRLMRPADARIGVTFLSDFPNSNTYYRLRTLNAKPAFHVAPHNLSVAGDCVAEGVEHDPDIWYRFRIATDVDASSVRIRAMFYREEETPPAEWQIDCVDESSGRRTNGTVGIWSVGDRGRWDDLRVVRR